MRDCSGSGLPIRRDDSHVPDDEEALATCTLNISSTSKAYTIIVWKILVEKEENSTYQSELEIAC